jgi:hypothetical protein
MVDEAFLPLHELVPELIPQLPDLVDQDAGVRTRITGYDVTTPVELDIVVRADGTVELGGAPPLYHLPTSVLPVLHSVRIVAVREDAS